MCPCHLGDRLPATGARSWGAAGHHLLGAMQEVNGWGQVVHVGGGRFHRVDEAVDLVHTEVDVHGVGGTFRAALVPLLALAGLVQLGSGCLFPFKCLQHARAAPKAGWSWVPRSRWLDDCALLHGDAIGLEVGFQHRTNPFAEIVLLQQVPDRQHRGFIRACGH